MILYDFERCLKPEELFESFRMRSKTEALLKRLLTPGSKTLSTLSICDDANCRIEQENARLWLLLQKKTCWKIILCRVPHELALLKVGSSRCVYAIAAADESCFISMMIERKRVDRAWLSQTPTKVSDREVLAEFRSQIRLLDWSSGDDTLA
ncbi:hypothetical protein EVAR_25939_1 [Eumeta japonica]|uniref:Uncharacterized protein n=1 Tax=Eumeta variegata TaxID=151549 RepID=A0A4C1S9M3_EUMVA|nr:hypothetical protein EVAR_25939_1 [Eumeta japonica]